MFRGLKFLTAGIISILTAACDRDFAISRSDEYEQNIVGGQSLPFDNELSKYVVQIKTTYLENKNKISESFCTGTLIHDRFILTAAHCLEFVSPIKFEVIFPLAKKTFVILKENIRIHEEYSANYFERDFEKLRDIGLISLNELPPQPYSSVSLFQFPIKMPDQFSFLSLGFGELEGIFLKKSDRPSEIHSQILSTENFVLSNSYFEVWQPQGGVCFGDSGSPALIKSKDGKFVQIGIAAEVLFNPGQAFEPNYDRCKAKSLFVNLNYFKNWIADSVK